MILYRGNSLDCITGPVTLGHWLAHIRVHNLVLGSTTLECDTWSRVEPHMTATLLYDLTCEALQSHLVPPIGYT